MATLSLSISGMSCGHCVAAVSSALKAIDGVEPKDVQIGSATVEYDAAKVTPAQVAQAVTEEGYVAVATA